LIEKQESASPEVIEETTQIDSNTKKRDLPEANETETLDVQIEEQ
jgi:hypothetical protein|tara:strand:+ start:2106 stop:2240 length:135 start_codon:yes stop_codon:yes gene_type:complete